jgi:hypothetical protein
MRSALLLSPLDVEQYLLELPPMSERQIAATLRFRLSALYPGDCKTARIDYVRNGGSRGSYAVFVMAEESLAAYRRAGGGKALVSQALMARELAPRGPWTCVSWTAQWAAIDRFKDRDLKESCRIARSGGARSDLSRLVMGLVEERIEKATVLVAVEALDEIKELGEACAELGLGAGEPRILPLAEAMGRIRVSRAVLFPPRPRARKARGYLLAALASADILLAGGLASRYVGALEAERGTLQARYLAMQRQNGASLRLIEELRAKEKKYKELAATEAPDMYALVAAIATNIGEGSRIIGLVVKEGNFQLEAEGHDALSALGALQGSGDFREVKLHQSVPGPSGIERYSLSGRYADDRR